MEETLPQADQPIKIDGRKLRKKSPKPQKRKYTRRAVPWQQRKGPIADAMRARLHANLEEKVWGPRRRKEVPAPRQGIPDGMNREQAQAMWAEAEASADKTMTELITQGVLDAPDVSDDAAMAAEAMRCALVTLRSASHHDVKLKAASLVLTYTKSKPETKQKVTVESAEDWLAQVVASEKNDDPGAN